MLTCFLSREVSHLYVSPRLRPRPPLPPPSYQDAAIPGVFGAMLGGLLCSQVVSDITDVAANPAFFKSLPVTYYEMMKHFIKSKKEVI